MFTPVALPEFDLPAISWAMCRNPMCVNFGIHFAPQKPPKEGAATYSDSRYRMSLSTGQMRCLNCGQSSKTKPNEAIRTIARYYLSLSFPFATCPNESCSNYGINVFEKHARRGSPYPRHYRRELEHKIRCRECNAVAHIGERRSIRMTAETKRTIQNIVLNVQQGVKKRRTVHFGRMSSGAYYRRLHRIGARLQDHHAWLNAGFLNPKTKVDFSEMAKVYTDVADISLRRTGDVWRSRLFKVIVSVLAFKRSYFLLAVHPFFLPAKYGPAPDESFYDPKTGWPSKVFARKWASIEHPIHNRFLKTSEQTRGDQADVSRYGQGFYIRSGYAELAHLLVVRRMLRRFERICFYMDSGSGLVPAAMVALADGIRERNVEVVLFQRQYKDRGLVRRPLADTGALGSERRRAALRKAWDQTEKRVGKRFEETIGAKVGKDLLSDPDRAAAKAFANAMVGAFSEKGEWAWLRYPAPMGKEHDCRSLWLTRMPGKTFEDAEEPLAHSTLQRVDSAIHALRSHARAMHRPGTRAAQGRDFSKSYVDPETVLSEIAIYSLGRNYSLLSADQHDIPACELGLVPSGRKPPDLPAIFERFRLGLSHADKISQWLRR